MVFHGVRGGGRRLEELRLGVRLLDAVHRLRARLAGAGAVLVERATNHGEHRPREDAARGDASRERSRRRGFLQAFLLLGEEFRHLLWIFAGVDFGVDAAGGGDEMRKLHERADASSRRDARKGEYARDGGRAGRSAHFALFPSEVHVLGETTSAAVVGVERVGAEVDEAQRPLDSLQRASLEIHRGEGQGETDDVVGGIDRVDRWDRSGRGGGVGVLGVVRAHERKTANGERFRVRGGRDLVEDRRLGLDRRPGVVRHGRIHLREHGNVVGLRAVEVGRGSVGVRERGRSVGTNRTRNEKEEQHIARMEPRADDDGAPARTLSNRRSRSRGRALARQSPWNCSTRLTRCGASTSSAVSAEDVARGEDARSSSRTIVASSSPPVATLASLAPGVDAFPGEDMPPEFARADPRTSRPRAVRFSPPATRAGVCASAGRTSTDERGDDRCSVSRATSQQRRGRGRSKLTLDDVDPYGAANDSYRRYINVHPALDPLPGSLASACDPSGGEGVGTGRVR